MNAALAHETPFPHEHPHAPMSVGTTLLITVVFYVTLSSLVVLLLRGFRRTSQKRTKLP